MVLRSMICGELTPCNLATCNTSSGSNKRFLLLPKKQFRETAAWNTAAPALNCCFQFLFSSCFFVSYPVYFLLFPHSVIKYVYPSLSAGCSKPFIIIYTTCYFPTSSIPVCHTLCILCIMRICLLAYCVS